MEDITFKTALEYGVIGAAFIYLLFFITNTLTKNLTKFGDTLEKISQAMISIDTRIGTLENRVRDLEERKRDT